MNTMLRPPIFLSDNSVEPITLIFTIPKFINTLKQDHLLVLAWMLEAFRAMTE
jgi:hypothetical protein